MRLDGDKVIIVFRVDASTQIGTGHMMRCLALASRMKKKYSADIIFLSRDLPGNINDRVEANGYRLLVLPRRTPNEKLKGYAAWLTVPQSQDAAESIEVLGNIGQIDRLVVDSYAIDETWEKCLRPWVGEIFVVDDLANRRHDCDILLDHGFLPGKEESYRKLVPEGCQLMLGVKYALIRDEFILARASLPPMKKNIRNILIFYGGADVTNETEKAIDALINLNLSGVDVEVIVGKSNPHKASVKQKCANYDFVHFHEQVSNMAWYMSNADILLCAGGTTLLEAWHLGLPTIVTAVAENQRIGCEYCAKMDLMDYLGFYDSVEVPNIIQAVQGMSYSRRCAIKEKCELLLNDD
ncbi:UDP-2,4-diacetamido-2,4,6-trideoxy-beta-L-altropyranose hydrolase [uncultured Anaerovibrio sp.]|uniref:UDP-2,4-diacetamido-2,4, 6-trideoxy-beta-L-altropyranose hydrolase n=1 Tax=uncultured Anaerovibrio sp. TaxID=361586 RepID=UPI00262B0050|nr:UDP-2,4-diacetamido-2,4,6-trideoxy-beta-L-altropyranose hydrolase [uncultured Anaerovibrio sp.]